VFVGEGFRLFPRARPGNKSNLFDVDSRVVAEEKALGKLLSVAQCEHLRRDCKMIQVSQE
jgi:hypothetical protein